MYAFVLHYAYATLVSPNFSYLGYRYESPEPWTVGVTLLAVWVCAISLPRRLDRPSGTVLWLLFTLTAAPTMLMGAYTSYLSSSRAVLLALMTALAVLAAIWISRVPLAIPRIVAPSNVFWAIVVGISLMTYGILIATQGLSLSLISLDSVYDVREDFSSSLAQAGILGYLVFNQANVVNPIIFARGIYSGRLWLVAVALLGQLVLYSGTGFKTILFSTMALIVVLLIFRSRVAPNGALLLAGAAVLMIAAAVLDDLFSERGFLTTLFSRRFLMTPGTFSSVYVAFFSDNPHALLGHSILSGWVDYPYSTTPPYLVADWMAGLPTMAANANLFADGFANFGWAGLIGAGVLLGVMVTALDTVSRGMPTWVPAIVMTMPVVALSNTSILTSILSHGLGLALVLLLLAPRDGWERRRTSAPRAADDSVGEGAVAREPGRIAA
ncbi:MAG: hypothetical protein Q4G34_04510 [Micrococcus sp.]|nr:hypothetical protein [Micrococcus sp.]